jgi:uncharacterized delta-60 repeat protein
VQRIEDRNLARRLTAPLLLAAVVFLADCGGSTTTEDAPPTAFAVLRLTNAGDADGTFAGGRAIVITDVDGGGLFDFALAVAVQPADNKILAAGSAGFAGEGSIALVRYDQNGVLDTAGFGTAGTGGIVRTPTPTGLTSASATAVAVQPADNKIVVAALTFNASNANTGIALIRYNPNGTLDTSFAAPNGLVTANIGPGAAESTCALLLQGTNIIVAGGSSNGSIVLYRYDQNGALDTTFGTDMGGGKTTTSLGAGTSAASPSLAFQAGKIIVASGTGSNTAVLRYSADGALDTTFGVPPTGIVTTDAGGTDFANAVAVQSNNRIVVAGHANVTSTTSDISLIRYNPGGDLDSTFGPSSNGIVTTNLGAFENALSLALQSPSAANTAILVSGNTGSGGITRTVVLRYTTLGSLDTTFAGTGVAVVSIAGPSSVASGNAVVVQSGLGIVVAGYD